MYHSSPPVIDYNRTSFQVKGEIKMENNNRFWPHIRRVTHIMMMAHRSCFDFHLFNAR
ncbi:Hypothetical protein ETEE_2013 [Edwardsiella anguillarum ET080813]|uniref:Leader peptide SpeFL n=1 Tax=Edwardsiella anguillarum ET080813 TaxID=667120 RepID=A0A076LPA6_9GAMM|nr:Hypothetical protein ETEE_2013 [Edwardsiella anguillarum ET080813]